MIRRTISIISRNTSVFRIIFFLSLFLLWGTHNSAAAVSQMLKPSTGDVLIIHNSLLTGPLPPGLVDGNHMLDLLGHFGLKGTLQPMENYRTGELSRYRFVIVMGVDDRLVKFPRTLLADIRAARVPVFWLADHAAELFKDERFAASLGFRIADGPALTGYNTVLYKGQSLIKGEPSLFPIQILDPSRVQVLATAVHQSDGQDSVSAPYIVRSGNFWYCADSPFSYAEEGDRYLAFCDLLHDFFGVQHPESHKALVRIEDVSVESDPEELQAVADYLYSRHVPFQVALIPIFKDPEAKEEIYLSDRPQFVRALHYMVAHGGTIIMHGVTHQFRGKSGDDYEFWDAQADKPVYGDSQAVVEQRLRMGLTECFANQIYPVTWETPHYVASENTYKTIGRFFNSSYERVSSVNETEAGEYFPFTTVDRFGRFIIPEDIGFIPMEKPDPEDLIQNAKRMLVVRDGIASFFFHPFLDIKYLQAVVDGIEKLGYHFVSVRDYNLRVQLGDFLVQTASEPVALPADAKYLHRFYLQADGSITGGTYTELKGKKEYIDSGHVPSNSVLVMEGVNEIQKQQEQPVISRWDRIGAWFRHKFHRKAAAASVLEQPRAVVLTSDGLPRIEQNDEASFVSALSVYGIHTSAQDWKTFEADRLPEDTILVAPYGVAVKLPTDKVTQIQTFVKRGGRLVLDGPASLLSRSMGIRHQRRAIQMRTIDEMMYGTEKITWNPPARVERFTLPKTLAVYARDEESELPVAMLGGVQDGRFLYLSARLDPITKLGYTRYPELIHYMREAFKLDLPVQRRQVELYFDPALSKRQGAEDKMAERWSKMGVRAIYAAAYQFWPKWSYNYQHLVDVCHRNGILVYAWFEFPHVSMKFWEDHPEWRAKTATGEDGVEGWRRHMDLDIPECRKAVFDFAADFIKKYDWDGVNIAELNYDTVNGPETPKYYLPMGAATRTAFSAQEHFDPILLFNPKSPYYWRRNPAALKKFEIYRSQRVLAWHQELLDKITPIAASRDMEVIVTMLDSLHSKTVTRDTGMDSRLILPLMKQYPFTLQVEDPAHFWADSPDRYQKFAETYLKLVPDSRRLMFDINVVSDRDIAKSSAPTPTDMGIELAQTVVSAGQASGRVALYSEGTIPYQDMELLSRVMAHSAEVDTHSNSWAVTSKTSLILKAPGKWQNYRVDGQIWPGWGKDTVIMPPGDHQITPFKPRFRLVDTSALDMRLLRFNGDMDTLGPNKQGFGFSYDSMTRALAMLNREPHDILVDGVSYGGYSFPYAGYWNVRLPSGKHRVDVIADSTASVIVNTTSLYSATAIVIFGAVTCGLMGFLYMSILVRRAFSRTRKG